MNKYQEIMNKISINESIESKILNDINSSKKSSFNLKKITAIAACFFIFIFGSFSIKNIINKDVAIPNEMIVVSSLEELEKELGMDIETLNYIPFKYDSIIYTNLFAELAEVEYKNEKQNLIFRKAIGNKDISGVYENFTSKEININGTSFTLNSTEKDKYVLATWISENFSYSIYLTTPISESEFIKILENIKN